MQSRFSLYVQKLTSLKIASGLVRLALVAMVIWITSGWKSGTATVSPFAAVMLAIVTGSIATVPVLILFASLFWRRPMCRWLCPMGLMFDLTVWLNRLFARFCPPVKRLRIVSRWLPDIKYSLAIGTIIGAVWGLPLFLFLDPLGLFMGMVNYTVTALGGAATVESASEAGNPVLWQPGILIAPAILTMSIIFPRFWCTKVCPLGAIEELCLMPKQLLGRLLLYRRTGQVPLKRMSIQRRVDLFTTAALLGGLTTWLLGGRTASNSVRLSEIILKQSGNHKFPPSARLTSELAIICMRCGNCERACPTGLIQPIPREDSLLLWNVPELKFGRTAYCDSTCNRCTEVCPVEALQPMTLEQKNEVRLAVPKIEFPLCRLFWEKECRICLRECPNEAIDFRWSEEEYLNIPEINLDLCNGCGRCAVVCPGDNAWEIDQNPDLPLRHAITIQ